MPTTLAEPPRLASELSEHHKAHGQNWLKWLGHLKGKTGTAGVEIGTWKGESAEWMLEHIFTGPLASYTCVDTFKGSDEHHLAGIDCTTLYEETRTRLARFGDRVVIARNESHIYLLNRDHPFDFIYIDGAHDGMSVLRDSVLAFDLLRPGGIMLWDDYLWDVMKDEVDRPKIAVDAFLACYARQCEVIGYGGWQVAVRKVA